MTMTPTAPTPVADTAAVRFAVRALPWAGERPNELNRTMAAHPLMYQELPYEPEYTIYNRRLTPASLTNATADEMYWKVRREVILRHTGELPVEVEGPDAAELLDRVCTRRIAPMRVGRCSYQFACFEDGGMITDGVLVRLAEDRFWFVQADGDLISWLRAHASGLDVAVRDPRVWVSQVQGPKSLDVLAAVVDGDPPEPFKYFDAAEVSIGGQPVVITRSGFSNELGWEFYLRPGMDAAAVGDRILDVGETDGMIITSAEVFRARRIEAGLLNAGSDFDETTTPFAAGLGGFVDLDKDFVGRSALVDADQRCRTWGLEVEGGVAQLGRAVRPGDGGDAIATVCSSGWSPFQQCGVAIVRVDDPGLTPDLRRTLRVRCVDDSDRSARLRTLPMIDPERLIPRGKLVDVPEVPDGPLTIGT